jgi:hypothetical protein
MLKIIYLINDLKLLIDRSLQFHNHKPISVREELEESVPELVSDYLQKKHLESWPYHPHQRYRGLGFHKSFYSSLLLEC